MTEVLLTLHCAAADAAAIGETLRDAMETPVHLRTEAVLGLDFGDATAAERVSARLDRRAIELVIDQDRLPAALARVGGLKRAGPVRWYVTAILDRGRLP